MQENMSSSLAQKGLSRQATELPVIDKHWHAKNKTPAYALDCSACHTTERNLLKRKGLLQHAPHRNFLGTQTIAGVKIKQWLGIKLAGGGPNNFKTGH